MQLLSLSPTMAALAAPSALPRYQELLQHPEFQHLQSFLLAQMAATQVVAILAYWLASKAVAEKEKSTISSALKLWLSYLIFSVFSVFATFVVMGFVAVTAKGTQFAGPYILTIVGLAALLFLFVILFIPMNIYSIGIIRAFLFLLIAVFITFAAMIPVDLVLVTSMGGGKSVAMLQSALVKSRGDPKLLLIDLKAESAPDEIDRMLYEADPPLGPKPSLKEREAMVVTIQQKLAARKATLAPGNAAAQAAFQNQLNRYMQVRASVINEINTHPGASPSSAPAGH